MKIDLNDLEADIEIEKIPASYGGSDDYGNREVIAADIMITSVKVKGIELITLFTPEELEDMAAIIKDKGL